MDVCWGGGHAQLPRFHTQLSLLSGNVTTLHPLARARNLEILDTSLALTFQLQDAPSPFPRPLPPLSCHPPLSEYMYWVLRHLPSFLHRVAKVIFKEVNQITFFLA